MYEVRTILCPMDFSAHSRAALSLAASLARDHDARLIVVHVMPPPLAYDEVATPLPYSFYEAKVRDELEGSGIDDVPVAITLVEGDPAGEILRVAEETSADLIVMGTHGRTGLSRALMGSVAETVLRKAGCPVLTVKGRAAMQARDACSRLSMVS
ncbi:MAG: universal stress protein UspA [Gemmatales bacterium]|nr:MAG: universal stress protein UspA [Gemmatales bacterium]